MSYEINFDSRTPAEAVQRAVSARYGIDPASIYVGDADDLGDYTGPDPDVLISPASGEARFACVLQAGDALRGATGGKSELELATELCRELGTRAIVSDGGMASSVWTLVTADGWHGRVVVDDDRLDDEGFVILYAFQPVPSEPGLKVEAPPAWQAGWYPDGNVPT